MVFIRKFLTITFSAYFGLITTFLLAIGNSTIFKAMHNDYCTSIVTMEEGWFIFMFILVITILGEFIFVSFILFKVFCRVLQMIIGSLNVYLLINIILNYIKNEDKLFQFNEFSIDRVWSDLKKKYFYIRKVKFIRY